MVTRALPPELTAEEWREAGLDPDNPFRYGWRYVQRRREDGTTSYEQVPLTLEDVLHPQEEDFVVQGEEHIDWCRYLHTALAYLLAHDPTAVVFQDMLFLWDVPGLKGHGPDLAVVFGVHPGQRDSFDVAAEGARPALVIEITSPSTARLDRQSKLEEYHYAGVPFYIIIGRQRTVRLLGYRATPVGYEPLTPNERGWLWLEPVNAWLGLAEGNPVCYNAAGEAIGDYQQVATERDDALTHAEAAEARLRELEATLRRFQQGQE